MKIPFVKTVPTTSYWIVFGVESPSDKEQTQMAYCLGSFVSEEEEEVNTVIKETNPKLLTSVYLSSVSEADPLFGTQSEFLNVYHDRPTDWAIDYTKSKFALKRPTPIENGTMKTGIFRCALKRPYNSKIKDFDLKLG